MCESPHAVLAPAVQVPGLRPSPGVRGFVGQSGDKGVRWARRGGGPVSDASPRAPGQLWSREQGTEACVLTSRAGFEKEHPSPPWRRGSPGFAWPRQAEPRPQSAAGAIAKAETRASDRGGRDKSHRSTSVSWLFPCLAVRPSEHSGASPALSFPSCEMGTAMALHGGGVSTKGV